MSAITYNRGLVSPATSARRQFPRADFALKSPKSIEMEKERHDQIDSVGHDQGNLLMLALQGGERSALSQLLDLYNDRLYRFVYRIVTDAKVAEDLVQESWLSLYEARESYKPTFRFSTWLYTIARRKCLSELRRRKVRSIVKPITEKRSGGEESSIELPQVTFHSPEESAGGSILANLIDRALNNLSEMQRQVIMLRDVEGMENEEVATVLGWELKPGAIRKRVFDARSAFRVQLIKLGYVADPISAANEEENVNDE